MNKMCELCRRTESEAMADAKTLGLLQEFESGIYTCCQVTQWADEQALAWFEAAREDGQRAREENAQPVFVFVQPRRPPVPWHKNPSDRT